MNWKERAKLDQDLTTLAIVSKYGRNRKAALNMFARLLAGYPKMETDYWNDKLAASFKRGELSAAKAAVLWIYGAIAEYSPLICTRRATCPARWAAFEGFAQALTTSYDDWVFSQSARSAVYRRAREMRFSL